MRSVIQSNAFTSRSRARACTRPALRKTQAASLFVPSSARRIERARGEPGNLPKVGEEFLEILSTKTQAKTVPLRWFSGVAKTSEISLLGWERGEGRGEEGGGGGRGGKGSRTKKRQIVVFKKEYQALKLCRDGFASARTRLSRVYISGYTTQAYRKRGK